MPPVVASGVKTSQGKKTLVIVAGASDNIFALDAENGNHVWTRAFDTHVLPKDESFWLCPNGVNATPTIDRSRNLVYAMAVDGRLYGLDLGTGEESFGPAQFVAPFSKNWSLNLFEDQFFPPCRRAAVVSSLDFIRWTCAMRCTPSYATSLSPEVTERVFGAAEDRWRAKITRTPPRVTENSIRRAKRSAAV